MQVIQPGPRRASSAMLAGAIIAVLAAITLGLTVGPVRVTGWRALIEALNSFPGVSLASGLTETQSLIVSELRLPRVALGLLVGATLGMAGTAYQGVFRNPLADPYLLGAAAGAGLGATLAIGLGLGGSGLGGLGVAASTLGPASPVPLFAFMGAIGAVAITYTVGSGGDRRRSTASLLLAGVAVAALAAAAQTFLQQRYVDDIRQVYSWIFGRLSTAGWSEVTLILPYLSVSAVVLMAYRRSLDVLSVGDDEATTLGLRVERTRLIIVAAASLGTAAAVAVSGLIGFVGIIVPHAIRLTGVTSHRALIPLSMLVGGAFLVVADVLARQVLAPAELPIGVVTALVGAPFFVLLLRSKRSVPIL